jgi:hypothetical protein
VDAVCINQADVGERNHQVSNMHIIYTLAQSVVVWLGESGNHSDLTLDLVQNAAAVWRESEGVELDPIFHGKRNSTEGVPGQMARFITGWLALAQLFRRPWWRRVWAVQEVVFARSCVVRCGKRVIDWKDFVDAYFLLWTWPSL